ncbi:hypothetical protein FoTM2_012033 [Fusarium oxysporum f. sp. vasinfectum]|uniref:Fucose-specific lectin n=1 Tax=Fusarium oxysporum f. sp. vasinfectum 25433 TaxID=1089449 RepID=X0L1L9_FUSOX|nr:hypothetical protein FOTG_16685 [Fusarium oxysporum f. sp. vasinfectum 25433]KAK2926859.1 hypothetical protein FoTM2_012033 [Fusarium oxysporum f. sp. vasinfectum]
MTGCCSAGLLTASLVSFSNRRTNLKVNGNAIHVNRELPILAAVTYRNPNGGEDEVRVYYVAQNKFVLRELRRTGGEDADWFDGQVFNNQQNRILNTSGLTANVVRTRTDQQQLKLYYQTETDELNVTFSMLGSSDVWSNRADVTN